MAEMDQFDFSMMIEESEADTFMTEYRLRASLEETSNCLTRW